MIQRLVQQRILLQEEFAYEKEQFKRLTEAQGIRSKVRRGLCWSPLRVGAAYRNSLDQLVISVERTEGLGDDHQFEPGKPVCFLEEDASGMLHYMRWTAQVSYVDADRMVVSLPSQQAAEQLQSADRLGVQLYLDERTYKLMFEALDRVIEAKTGRLAELRDVCHASAPLSKFTFAPTRFPWLNPSQEQAVNEVLWAKDVAVVHGPPGTGKTTTLVEAIYETLRRETQVLVCAQSNMAVDWISQKLAERGVNVLRIGNPSRVTDQMLNDTYERRFESHPLYSQLWGVRRTIRQLYDHPQGSAENRHQKIARLKDRAMEFEFQIRESLFDEARVVACTLAGSAHPLLLGKTFGTLFVDEAAQALEAACWIAIQRCHRFVLAGDHRQLPPTIQSPQAQKGGLDRTLMQQIVDNKPQAVSLLTVQYRMSDEIMRFPNEMFYDGRLTSHSSVRYRSILDWERGVEWVDTDSLESTSPASVDPASAQENPGEALACDGVSRVNVAEAEFTLLTLKRYIERIGQERFLYERLDVGLISPYKGQVRLLRQLMKRDAFWKPYRRFITIDTVDGFQGQERDIIVLSMVRQNDSGQIGFLSDLRRMNVAMTRARMKLIIVGNQQTLSHHPFYRRLIAYAESL